MSDREAIVQTLKQVESRIRSNRQVQRLAVRTSLLFITALVVKIWDLIYPLKSTVIEVFWILWFIALVALISATLMKAKGSLGTAAVQIDRRARLKNEITSAYWFMKQRSNDNPWIELQVHRAAKTVRGLNSKILFPRVFGLTSYVTICFAALLLTLNFAPLPIDHNWPHPNDAPTLILSNEDEALLEEISELVDEAEKLQEDEVVQQLEELIKALRNNQLSTSEVMEELNQIQDLMDEGNLSMASIIEGLDSIGKNLQESEETRMTGEAISETELERAAEELNQLSEKLEFEETSDGKLKEVLEQASNNRNPGLEELTQRLHEAFESLQNEDEQGLQEALKEASRELRDLARIVESQQIKNQASQQLEDLRNSLREQQQEQQLALDEALEEIQQRETGELQEQQQAGEGQQGQLNTEPEFAPGGVGEGQMTEQAQGPGQLIDSQGLDASGTGQMPSGLGFSPEQKEGLPTSLDVQLLEERMEAQRSEDLESEAKKIEEESSEQRSRLDYRNVESDLTPAQLDILNQDQIPREYKQLIKEYFQIIRPQPKQ